MEYMLFVVFAAQGAFFQLAAHREETPKRRDFSVLLLAASLVVMVLSMRLNPGSEFLPLVCAVIASYAAGSGACRLGLRLFRKRER